LPSSSHIDRSPQTILNQNFKKCESKKRTNKEKKYRHADAVVIEMERQGER
jgi:hypothetical protein